MAGDEHYPRATTPPPGTPRHRRGEGLLTNPVFLAVMSAGVVGLVLGAAFGVFGGTGSKNPSGTQLPTESIASLPGETPSAGLATPTATVTVSGTPGTGTTSVRPVYYVGREPGPGGRLLLYREFRHVRSEGSSDPVAAAVQAMLALPPLDPDYTSPWPSGTQVLGVSRSGEIATITLSEQVGVHRTDAGTAQIAAQQLVHTATAADRSIRSVRLAIGSQDTNSLFGHVVGQAPFSRAPEVDVIAPVWIIDPYEGATLPGTFTVGGSANVFEATVSYVVRRDGAIVAEDSIQATSGTGTRGEWLVRLNLPPGEYVIEAFETSAEDGRPLFIDSKRVTVS